MSVCGVFALGIGLGWVRGANRPTGMDRVVTLLEDGTTTLAPAVFGFSDAGDVQPHTFTRVRITELPTSGVLSVDGKPITRGQYIGVTPMPGIEWAIRDQSVNSEEPLQWQGMAISADGMTMAAIGYTRWGARLFFSVDGGLTWQPRSEQAGWSDVACSADGTRWLAADYLGRLYVSDDTGMNWSARSDDTTWSKVTSSADGRRLYAVSANRGLFRSVDFGLTWERLVDAPTGIRLSVSQDGLRLTVVTPEGVQVSKDGGASWELRGQLPGSCLSIAASADGMRLATVTYTSVGAELTGYRCLSSDGGGSWMVEPSATYWTSVTSSADGRVLATAASPGTVHVSWDFGATWVSRGSEGRLHTVAVSADGRRLVAGGASPLVVSEPSIPRISFSPGADDHGRPYASLRFQVEDSGPAPENLSEPPNQLTFDVESVNDAPTPELELEEQFAPVGTGFSWVVPSNAFADVDEGSVITLIATQTDGSVLPAWLAFDPATRIFSGVPPETARGLVPLRLTARDDGVPALSTSIDFALRVGSAAPSGTDGDVAMDEDGVLALTAHLFGFTDQGDTPPNSFTRVRVASIPTAGSLLEDGQPLAAGDVVPVVKEALLRWTRSGSPQNFDSIAVSADGMVVGAVGDSRLMFSSDSGQTWTAREQGRLWQQVACSSDGLKWIGCVFDGLIHTSSDQGATWQPRLEEKKWNCVASSDDGRTLVAGAYGDRLYVSTTGGLSWTPRGPIGGWVSVAGTAGGTRWIAAMDDGRLYVSETTGVTWVAVGETSQWYDVACSADGTMLAAVDGQNISLSTDFGQTWRVVKSAEAGTHWRDVALSSDGRHVAVVAYNGTIWTSRDRGRTWISRERPRAWRCVDCSVDGDVLFAAGQNVEVHRSQAVVPEFVFRPTANAFGSPYSSFTFQVEDNGQGGPTIDPSPNVLTVNVRPANDAPTVSRPLANRTALERSPFQIQVSSATFQDVDTGTTFSLKAALAGGRPLPDWLQFDSATRTFMGAPGTAQTGLLLIDLIATDNGNPPLSVTDQFEIVVGNIADAPEGRDGAIFVPLGRSHVFHPSDFSFEDPGDSPPDRLSRIRLTTLPEAGTLTIDGEPAEAGGFVRLVSSAVGAEWQPGMLSRSWSAIASSADGTRLLAAIGGSQGFGTLYVSADSGQTWTARGTSRAWYAATMSADGETMAAAGEGQIYVSIDAGVTWTARAESHSWRSLASSADGSRLVAGRRNGQLFTSGDSGVTWTPRESSRNWRGLASSHDGSRLAAADLGGRIYLSTDAGVTWNPSGPTGAWRSIAGSADGTRWFAVAEDGQIHVSWDGGAHWTAKEATRLWSAVACSADGSHVAAVAGNSQIFVSSDFGQTWRGRESARAWSSIATSADGSRWVAAVNNGLNGGLLYFSAIEPASQLVFTPAPAGLGAPYATFTYQIEDDGNLPSERLDLTPNTMQIDVANESPFQVWARGHGLPPDPTAGEGEHVLRFQFGMEAMGAPNSLHVVGDTVLARGLPVLRSPTTEAPGFALLYARRIGAGLTTWVEFTDGLSAWESATLPETIIATDEIVQVRRARFPDALSTGRSPRFARVVVRHP
ncbi:MAG: putative Ig domain-containing protein [Verrucomicrobiales bacterium]